MYICVTVLPPHWARLEKNDAYRLAPAALALHDGYKLALGAVEHQLDMAFGLFVVDDRASRSPEFKIMAATEPLPCDNILTRGGITGITASISTGIRSTTPSGAVAITLSPATAFACRRIVGRVHQQIAPYIFSYNLIHRSNIISLNIASGAVSPSIIILRQR